MSVALFHSSGSEPVACRAHPREDPNQPASKSSVRPEPQSTLQLQPPSVQKAPQPFPCKAEPVLKWRLELGGSVRHEPKSLRKACCLRVLKPATAALKKPQSGSGCRKLPLGEALPTMLLRLLHVLGLSLKAGARRKFKPFNPPASGKKTSPKVQVGGGPRPRPPRPPSKVDSGVTVTQGFLCPSDAPLLLPLALGGAV